MSDLVGKFQRPVFSCHGSYITDAQFPLHMLNQGHLQLYNACVGVLPMVPSVGNICTIGTNGITIFTICTNFFTNGIIGN